MHKTKVKFKISDQKYVNIVIAFIKIVNHKFALSIF